MLINCVWYDKSTDKCGCVHMKKWYNKNPTCVMVEDYNNFCEFMIRRWGQTPEDKRKDKERNRY